MEPLIVHMRESDLPADLRSILKRVETGVQIVIDEDTRPIAIIRAAVPSGRKMSECIAMLPADSTATIDADFGRDIEAAITAHREPLEPGVCD